MFAALFVLAGLVTVDDPPLTDLARFPPPAVVQDYLGFNRQYRQHLEARYACEPQHRQEPGTALDETDALYWTWDCLRSAQSSWWDEPERRFQLELLRRTLGAEAYYAGRMPPCVPLWRFFLRN